MICIVPLILLFLAITDYIKNDETKVVWLEIIDEVPSEDGTMVYDNSGYHTVHSHSKNLLRLGVFFSWMYPILIHYSAPKLYIDRKTLIFRLFFYFSLFLLAITWITVFYDSATNGKLIGPNSL